MRRRAWTSAVVAAVALVAVACATTTLPSPTTTADLPPPATVTAISPASSADTTRSAFDVDAFSAINPEPELLTADGSVFNDMGWQPSVPRDAINPIYNPKFVSLAEVNLDPEELVMGLLINGDARAYPVGIMRFREMVNDDVGGIPVLITW